MEKYIYNEQNGLWYELQGDYYTPCLVLDEEDTQPIGMWGRKHLRYIKEHRPVIYTTLLLSGKMNSHLAQIDNRATEPKVKTEYFPRFRGYAPLAQLDRALVYGTKG